MLETEAVPGTVARLRSGGPKMTLANRIHGQDEIKCVWFADGIVQSAFFRIDCLVLVKEE